MKKQHVVFLKCIQNQVGSFILENILIIDHDFCEFIGSKFKENKCFQQLLKILYTWKIISTFLHPPQHLKQKHIMNICIVLSFQTSTPISQEYRAVRFSVDTGNCMQAAGGL